MVKFGKYKDKQKWHCQNCGITTIYVRARIRKKREVTHDKGAGIYNQGEIQNPN